MDKTKQEQKLFFLIKSLAECNDKEREEKYTTLKKSKNKNLNNLLIQFLEDENPLIRKLSADLLGERKETKSVPLLLQRLEDDNMGVILSVIIALGEIGDKRATKALCKMLEDKSPFFFFIRINVASAIAKIGDKEAIPALVEAIKEDDMIMMNSIMDALLIIDPYSAIEPLIDLINNKKSLCRDIAAEYLGLIGDERALNTLLKSLEEDDLELKLCSIQALGKMKNEKWIVPLINLYLKTDNNLIKKTIYQTFKNIKSSITELITKKTEIYEELNKILPLLEKKNYEKKSDIIELLQLYFNKGEIRKEQPENDR